ncbi:hypothetical protein [Porphyromonas sp. HMSC077F02]|uniref:hypothetical protein n=1 Tax=Porphyromonas sp. HMSC077F02 TaxID=1739529 RepID=UPI00033A533A|nr:hypothetical protein [Porphyromonas sp. HMSC077F02]CCY08954.1 unknown [Porphyromonas sp. CAG:1061]
MEQPNTISPAIEARIHAVVKAHNWSLCRGKKSNSKAIFQARQDENQQKVNLKRLN